MVSFGNAKGAHLCPVKGKERSCASAFWLHCRWRAFHTATFELPLPSVQFWLCQVGVANAAKNIYNRAERLLRTLTKTLGFGPKYFCQVGDELHFMDDFSSQVGNTIYFLP